MTRTSYTYSSGTRIALSFFLLSLIAAVAGLYISVAGLILHFAENTYNTIHFDFPIKLLTLPTSHAGQLLTFIPLTILWVWFAPNVVRFCIYLMSRGNELILSRDAVRSDQ